MPLIACLAAVALSPAQADESDTAVILFRVAGEDLRLSPEDVSEAKPLFGEQGAGLSFLLTPEAGAAFSDLTGRNIGSDLSLLVCGDELVTANIRARLEGAGQVALDSLGSAVFYAARMTGETPCG
jgi:preprotein translocase subunit SecD